MTSETADESMLRCAVARSNAAQASHSRRTQRQGASVALASNPTPGRKRCTRVEPNASAQASHYDVAAPLTELGRDFYRLLDRFAAHQRNQPCRIQHHDHRITRIGDLDGLFDQRRG